MAKRAAKTPRNKALQNHQRAGRGKTGHKTNEGHVKILSGKWRGRNIMVPAGDHIRPTSGRMRERLFNMLTHSRYPRLLHTRVADLFAGTGALGFEALSRGASHCDFIELNPASIHALKSNATHLNANNNCQIIKADASKLPACETAYDFIFMDAPYNQSLSEAALTSACAQGWIAAHTIICCELASDENFTLPENFMVIDDRTQGIQRILIISVSNLS